VRQLAAVLLSCAMFSVVLLAGPSHEAYAQGYDASGQAVVEDARSYIGMPYGVSGMDCSGFTSAVFADFGVYLPDSPGAQYAYGTPSQGKAGDLCSSTSQATASPTSEQQPATGR
jgi:cell wall-associated NlpC family hydrolase